MSARLVFILAARTKSDRGSCSSICWKSSRLLRTSLAMLTMRKSLSVVKSFMPVITKDGELHVLALLSKIKRLVGGHPQTKPSTNRFIFVPKSDTSVPITLKRAGISALRDLRSRFDGLIHIQQTIQFP